MAAEEVLVGWDKDRDLVMAALRLVLQLACSQRLATFLQLKNL